MEEKKKTNLEEKLKIERPADASPSPILSSLKEKNKALPVFILGGCLVLSIALNIFLGVIFFSNTIKIDVLEEEINKNQKTIQELRVNLNDLENPKT